MTRGDLAKELWEVSRGMADFTADPCFVSVSPFGNDEIAFHVIDYGAKIVVEAEGTIVETLCIRHAPVREQ